MRESVRMLLAFLLLGAFLDAGTRGVAHAQSPEDGGMTHEARMQQAVRYYQLGERVEARHVLAALVVDAGISLELRQQARVYLAEILLVDGNTAEARGFLEQVLLAEPDFVIDRFRHTPEVAGEFDYVKALLAKPPPDGNPDPPPDPPQPIVLTMPMSVWSPFGRYHFANGRAGRGLVYLTGVTGSAVASSFLHALWIADRSHETPEEEAALRGRRRAQWISTGVFYGFWGASVIDAQVHWRKNSVNLRVQPSVGFAPGADGATPALRVAGTF